MAVGGSFNNGIEYKGGVPFNGFKYSEGFKTPSKERNKPIMISKWDSSLNNKMFGIFLNVLGAVGILSAAGIATYIALNVRGSTTAFKAAGFGGAGVIFAVSGGVIWGGVHLIRRPYPKDPAYWEKFRADALLKSFDQIMNDYGTKDAFDHPDFMYILSPEELAVKFLAYAREKKLTYDQLMEFSIARKSDSVNPWGISFAAMKLSERIIEPIAMEEIQAHCISVGRHNNKYLDLDKLDRQYPATNTFLDPIRSGVVDWKHFSETFSAFVRIRNFNEINDRVVGRVPNVELNAMIKKKYNDKTPQQIYEIEKDGVLKLIAAGVIIDNAADSSKYLWKEILDTEFLHLQTFQAMAQKYSTNFILENYTEANIAHRIRKDIREKNLTSDDLKTHFPGIDIYKYVTRDGTDPDINAMLARDEDERKKHWQGIPIPKS